MAEAAASLRSQAQLLGGQSVGVVSKAGDRHGRHQDAADAGHGHQRGEHPAGVGLDSGRQGRRLPLMNLKPGRRSFLTASLKERSAVGAWPISPHLLGAALQNLQARLGLQEVLPCRYKPETGFRCEQEEDSE